MPDPNEAQRRLLIALGEIQLAAEANIERSLELRDRAKHLSERLTAGDDLVTLVTNEPRPRMVELLSANKTVLETSGAELRLAEAMALRTEGLTIEAIAELFGVTRQRISALLKQAHAANTN